LVFLINSTKININGVELAFSLRPTLKGFTAIILPPLGNVRAYTHSMLNIELKNIEVDMLMFLIDKSPAKSELWGLFKNKVTKALYLLVIKTAFLARISGSSFQV
jgi:hypothetical protein